MCQCKPCATRPCTFYNAHNITSATWVLPAKLCAPSHFPLYLNLWHIWDIYSVTVQICTWLMLKPQESGSERTGNGRKWPHHYMWLTLVWSRSPAEASLMSDSVTAETFLDNVWSNSATWFGFVDDCVCINKQSNLFLYFHRCFKGSRDIRKKRDYIPSPSLSSLFYFLSTCSHILPLMTE